MTANERVRLGAFYRELDRQLDRKLEADIRRSEKLDGSGKGEPTGIKPSVPTTGMDSE